MTFKKDYINYLLHTVVSSSSSELSDNLRLRRLVNRIVSMNDVVEMTYLIGKTAGLETLFKYLLYVSDKIDKSQITVFNIKDNFEYDIKNLSKICEKIAQYKSQNVSEAIENIPEETPEAIKIEAAEEDKTSNVISMEESEEAQEESEDSKLTLIENTESYRGEAEVFELESITESLETTDAIEETKSPEEKKEQAGESAEEDEVIDIVDEKKAVGKSDQQTEDEALVVEMLESEEKTEGDSEPAEEELPEVEIEVHKPVIADSYSSEKEPVKEEAITNEAYLKFEGKFFEEVKILEKLFSSVDKDCKKDDAGKLSEKCLQCLTEIVEITSELANLSRQLSFDLIADIFLTMNLYFTKAISAPRILISERIKLLDSSLALVNSLIKGEDYLNYDAIVDKMEKLKSEVMGAEEEDFTKEEPPAEEKTQPEAVVSKEEKSEAPVESEYIEENEESAVIQDETIIFKLKYLVKEFEKIFNSLGDITGEYSKFDALEKINDLNNTIRMIAKIASSMKMYDLLKLSEVTYVFLKYLKDYRMDLLDAEIQQIIKYIIFTFKMILTNKKPDDFNILVRHLNNPVKIFTDS
jgi:hypothetical protein